MIDDDPSPYEAAMMIRDRETAKACLAGLVTAYRRERPGVDVEEATRIVRSDLGYFAGYFDAETRRRIEDLFECSHPLLGAIAERGSPSVADCIQVGFAVGKAMSEEHDGEA